MKLEFQKVLDNKGDHFVIRNNEKGGKKGALSFKAVKSLFEKGDILNNGVIFNDVIYFEIDIISVITII